MDTSYMLEMDELMSGIVYLNSNSRPQILLMRAGFLFDGSLDLRKVSGYNKLGSIKL